jgi:dienelactone hydrolase
MAGKILGELVVFDTRDRISLDGFYIKKKGSRKGIIYLHGLCGMMCGGKRFESIANAAASAGYHMLTFNNRGFGMVNSFRKTTKKGGWFTAGGSMENFKDCRLDIQAAVDFLKKKGCRKIIIAGSSTGCQKSIYYLTHHPDRKVRGVILMAPVNDTEGDIVTLGKSEFDRLFRKAKNLTKKGRGEALVTSLSAKRFYDLHKLHSLESRLLDFNQKKMRYISKIRVPILALLGDADPYVTPGRHQERLDKICASANPRTKCETVLVKKGDHAFKDNLPAMSRAIRDWLKRH